MSLCHKTSAIIFVIAVLGMSVSLGAHAEQAGEKIVYNSAPEGSPPWPQEDIYSVNADGSDEKALTSDHHSHNPALSPDGKTILFIHDSKSFHQVELFLMARDGSNVRRLLRGENIDIPAYTPAWSPDGKMIAVSYTPEEWDDNSKFGLFLVSADGKQAPRLFKEKGWGAKWSPDGKKLAYSINTSEKNWSLFLANADGSDEVELAPERAWGINWSPDGKKLAFIANPTPGMWAVHVFDLDRHQDNQLTDIKTYRYAEGGEWSPDGKQIAFDAEISHSGPTGSWIYQYPIFVMDPDGSNIRQLDTNPDWNCRGPKWSPDGRNLAFFCDRSHTCTAGTAGPGGENACVRRIFVISTIDPTAKAVQITHHSGGFLEFTPQ